VPLEVELSPPEVGGLLSEVPDILMWSVLDCLKRVGEWEKSWTVLPMRAGTFLVFFFSFRRMEHETQAAADFLESKYEIWGPKN
jgi:hypothetical protein